MQTFDNNILKFYNLCMSKMKVQTFTVSPELQKRLKEYASKHNLSDSEVIRTALNDLMNQPVMPLYTSMETDNRASIQVPLSEAVRAWLQAIRTGIRMEQESINEILFRIFDSWSGMKKARKKSERRKVSKKRRERNVQEKKFFIKKEGRQT